MCVEYKNRKHEVEDRSEEAEKPCDSPKQEYEGVGDKNRMFTGSCLPFLAVELAELSISMQSI